MCDEEGLAVTLRLHQLEGFYWTGLTGGYTKAAEAMPYPITEPAVYQQVRKLERLVGVPLVAQAKPRRTVLTPEGRALHEFIAPFFTGLPRVVEGVKRREHARVSVAVDGALGCALVAPAIATLRAKRPAAEVSLVDRDSQGVARAVETGDADLGLAVLGFVSSGGLIREEPLAIVRVALCVPEAHPLARRRKPPLPSDLDDVPLCVYHREHPGRAIVERAFRDAGIKLRVAAEATSIESLRALVSAGVAPAFIPVASPAVRRRARGIPGLTGIVPFDVTGLVPGEPVRMGLLTRSVGRHPVVTELADILRRPQ
jgi:DNA-binding transcriptional LysR family regulator